MFKNEYIQQIKCDQSTDLILNIKYPVIQYSNQMENQRQHEMNIAILNIYKRDIMLNTNIIQ